METSPLPTKGYEFENCHWVVRVFRCVTPTVTRDLGFNGLFRRTCCLAFNNGIKRLRSVVSAIGIGTLTIRIRGGRCSIVFTSIKDKADITGPNSQSSIVSCILFLHTMDAMDATFYQRLWFALPMFPHDLLFLSSRRPLHRYLPARVPLPPHHSQHLPDGPRGHQCQSRPQRRRKLYPHHGVTGGDHGWR